MTKRFGVPQARQDRSNALTAFTLAEVLITLGIIGVVAAMTIPTLISNTNGAQFKTAYKKALSTLNQAILMNIAMEDTDFSTLVADTATGDAAVTKGSLGALLGIRLQSATDITESYFETVGTAGTDNSITLPAMEYTTTYTCKQDDVDDNTHGCTALNEEVDIEVSVDAPTNSTWRVYSFADGTSFAYLKDAANCDEIKDNCVGFIDVNGSTGPNTPIDCSSGTAADGEEEITECSSDKITDIYPVFFHGQTVEPANVSARAVLFGK